MFRLTLDCPCGHRTLRNYNASAYFMDPGVLLAALVIPCGSIICPECDTVLILVENRPTGGHSFQVDGKARLSFRRVEEP
jgi:hypothetical protein